MSHRPRTARTHRSLALLLALACTPTEWTTLASPEGGFEVELPAAPELSRQKVDTAAGPLDFTLYHARDGGTSYQVTWVEYPPGAVEDPEAVLDAARDGALASLAAALVGEERIELAGHPGREIELDVQGRLSALGRLYLVGDRFYQLLLATDARDPRGPGATRFLESFRLLPPSQRATDRS